MDNALITVLLIALTAGLALAVIFALIKRPVSAADISTPLQNLTQAVQQGHAHTAVLTEKLVRLEPLAQAVGGVQVELRGLAERVSIVEQTQNQVSQGVVAIGSGLAQASTITRGLVDATAAIREEIARAKTDLTELGTHTRARQELDLRTADSIRRIESIIAGTQTRGAAGENILDVVFSKLPADWQVRNFRIGDRVVEFGLRLPNNLVLPIDSKWSGTTLLEQLAKSSDPADQRRLRAQIAEAVLARAKEVRKYIDPNLTVGFGVAAIPDAVYEVCAGIQAEVFQLNVVLVSYSMFLPYLLLVIHTMFKSSQTLDLEKLTGYLQEIQGSIKLLQDELEGRISRALTMLGNSRDEMRAHLGRLSSGLASLRIGAAACTELSLSPAGFQASPEPDPLELL